MKLGKSKIKDIVYVDVYDQKAQALEAEGYEVFVLGGRPVYLALKSNMGACSGPTQYSARHCFGSPLADVKNKTYEVAGYDVKGYVIKDYSPPLWNILSQLSRFFGEKIGVRDVVKVSMPYWSSDGQVGVVTGGVLGAPIGLFTNVPIVEPEDVVDKDVLVDVDVPEQDTIQCRVFDYAVIDILVDKVPWPHEVLVAQCKKPLRQGNSGGAVRLKGNE
jgi:hypothetical protein